MNADPIRTLDDSPMSRRQVIVVATMIALNALDGFDVLSISFAAPGIASEWGIDRAALGIVLSMELIGMAIGSLLLGSLADKVGRRPTTLGCLVLMSIGMLMATTATGVFDLSFWRILTGFGIGGMLATTNAITAEFSSAKRRPLNISIMVAGYPVGVVAGGAVVAQLLEAGSWRSIFYFGAAVTALCIPLVWFVVPETVHWLVRRQPAEALQRVNYTLALLSRSAVSTLPPAPERTDRNPFFDLFAASQITKTFAVSLAFFFHMLTFYFVMKWTPKIVVDLGFTASEAARVLVWTTVGAALGCATFGLLTQKTDVRRLTIAAMGLSVVMVTIYGRTPADLQQLSVIGGCVGFCTNAAISGMFALFAQVFPKYVLASGTGFAIGIGRGGAVLAPIIAGYLFEHGVVLSSVTLIMGTGSLIGGLSLVLLRFWPLAEQSVGHASTPGVASARKPVVDRPR